jgi:hypothetical protein
MEVTGQLHASAALPTGKNPRYLLDKRLSGPPEPVWTLWSTEKSLAPARNRTLAVHSVARRYTD